MSDILVAYEKGNPFEVFMYRLVDFGVNTFETQILDNRKPGKTRYVFTLHHDNLVNVMERIRLLNGKVAEAIQKGGKNAYYHFIVEPLEYDKFTRSGLFLIRESHIELRRYPRIYLKQPLIEAEFEGLTGFVKNISIGGARIKLSKNLTGEIIEDLVKKGKFPGNFKLVGLNKSYELKLKPVAFDIFKSEISVKFEDTSLENVKFYKDIQKILKTKEEVVG